MESSTDVRAWRPVRGGSAQGPAPAAFGTAARIGARVAALVAALILSGCGGGGGGAAAGSSTPVGEDGCSLDAQKADLRNYLSAEYLWYRQLQAPDPAASGSLSAYLGVLISPGVAGDAALPRDRWSGVQTTQSFNRFFGEGQSLGYGVSVAGLEVANTTEPLRVRHVEPRSPAAGLVRRGDTIVQVNGRAASELTAANDFAWLETATEGVNLDLVLRDLAGGERSVRLTSRVFDLTPVWTTTVLTSPGGRSTGYLVLKDFIGAGQAGIGAAFTQFRAAGVRELVLDLRYNGGGLVSLAADLASQVVKASVVGQPFNTLVYSDRQAASNFTYRFTTRPNALGLDRVYVLTGQRTCSASELVVNGLAPFVDVVQIGGTTCGKPVGFVPLDNRCGSTVSAVNFESLNARNDGRYWDGLRPTCRIAEDWNRALGDPAEVLLAAALAHMDSGSCPAATAGSEERLMALSARLRESARRGVREGGDFVGMIDR
jgi:carboxyl-terminal processing protease